MHGAFFIPKITAGPAEYKKGGAKNVDWHDKKEWRGKEHNMKLQWLKEIVGDAYTEEMDAAVCQALGKEFVARADFNEKNAKVKELETQVTQLNDTVKARDKQLDDLKKSAGDNEDLKNQIDTLTQQNKDQKAAHEKELAEVKLMAAVDAELTAAGSKNNIAVKAILADFLKDAKIVDGKVTSKGASGDETLAAKLDALKKDATADFMFGAANNRSGWKPGENGDGSKQGGDKKPSEMSYSELSEYLAKNPDAKLE